MSQATGPISKIGCSPLIIAAAVAVVAAIVGGFFLFASPSTEESTSVDPCSSEVSFLLMDEQDGCVDPWPLTTTSGELWCFEADTGNEVFWFTGSDEDGEIAYGVNDAALAWGDLDIDLIRKDAPEGSAELKVDLEPLLKVGLSLCGNPPPLTDDEEFDLCQMPDSENEWWQEEVYGCFDPWPFTVTEGSIIGFVGDAACEVVLMAQAPDDSVFISYAVNDVAVGIAEAGVFDHADIDLIRKSAGEIGPFVEAGLSLCENFQSSKPIDGEGRTRGSDDESAMD